MTQDTAIFEQFLVEKGILTEDQLNQAQARSLSRKISLREACTDLKLLQDKMYDQHLADFFELPYIDLQNYFADPQVLGLIDKTFALNECIFPLFLSSNTIAIATANPSNLQPIDRIRDNTRLDVDLYYAAADAILESIDRNYTHATLLSEDPGAEAAGGDSSQDDIPQIVDALFNQAVRAGASDLHIEPGENRLIIRQRIDGILQEVNTLSKSLQERLVSRIKVLAKLDISETRIPLDGQIKQVIAGEKVSLRISTVPTLYGENVVIRFLFNSKNKLSLDTLGFSPSNLQAFRNMLKAPYGMIVVTDPTGSGKSTTLYAALDQLNTIKKNIMTIEDPVEYSMELVRQIQVNPKTGLTFAAGLRSILRQDPDVIMVGEIRDEETASVAVQSALTGHLVLSTLHTNTAGGAITRLIHMGIPNYLIASAVIGVVGQRLVRVLCPTCKQEDPQGAKVYGSLLKPNATVYGPCGCNRCNQTGYTGRKGIYECLTVTEEIQSAILENASTSTYEGIAVKQGMVTMVEEGLGKVMAGETSPTEIMLANQMVAEEKTDDGEASP